MSFLDGSPLKQAIEEMQQFVKDYYDSIRFKIPEFKQFSLKEFAEVMAIIMSRAFDMDQDGVNKNLNLVALVDMINHDNLKHNSHYYDVHNENGIKEALVVTAT